MAEGKELKPKSFRIDDETAEKFKEISGSIGGNQQETLAKLIEAYEFQAGKAILTDRKADIELFEKYVNAITRMFMGSLEDNQSITETVRTEFEALLKSKDTTIQDLQENLTVAKQLKEDAVMRAREYSDENEKLHQEVGRLNDEFASKMDDMQSMLSDKDSLNKALTDSCNDLKVRVEGMKGAAKQAEALQRELDKLSEEYKNAVKEKDGLAKQLSEERASHKDDMDRQKEQLQLTLEKTLLEIERKHQEQLQQLKAEQQAEIDKYQGKYFELLEKLQSV